MYIQSQRWFFLFLSGVVGGRLSHLKQRPSKPQLPSAATAIQNVEACKLCVGDANLHWHRELSSIVVGC